MDNWKSYIEPIIARDLKIWPKKEKEDRDQENERTIDQNPARGGPTKRRPRKNHAKLDQDRRAKAETNQLMKDEQMNNNFFLNKIRSEEGQRNKKTTTKPRENAY